MKCGTSFGLNTYRRERMNMMQTRMAIEMIARMTASERQAFIAEMDKRFPNLVDDLGSYIGVTQQERQMELDL